MARVATIDPETLLSPAELSAFLQIPEETLSKWRSNGTGPRYMRMGKHARYRMSDVRVWMDDLCDRALAALTSAPSWRGLRTTPKRRS